MRPLVAAVLCILTPLASPAVGEQTIPYKAFVVADEVYVRSGPGQSYYPTDKLKRGQAVEVYRHDPGGWCAVRPVEGSFTWVSGRFLQPTKDNLAVVTEDGVSARVGSRFSDTKDVIQVRLKKGEMVEVIEAPRNGEHWYKIAPPSGEFRWVSGKYLDADYPRDGIRHKRSERAEPDHRPADRNVDGRDRPDRRDHNISPRSGESLQTKSAEPRSIAPKEFKEELENIELELSVMVIEDPTTWSFDELVVRTNVLLDQARTAVERGRARLLANRIARFEDIKRRQEEVLAMRERTDRQSRMWAGLRPKDEHGERPRAVVETDGRFDGVGRLARVDSPKLGAPRYALMSESNEVLCYVTPVPGVNLHDYLGQRVGVNGARGYIPEQHAGHVMARHVTPLDDGRLLR